MSVGGCKQAETGLTDDPAIQSLRAAGSSVAIAPGNDLVQLSFNLTLPTGHHPDALVLQPTAVVDPGFERNWDDVARALSGLADRVSLMRIELGSLPDAEYLVDALPDNYPATIKSREANWHVVEILVQQTAGE